MRFAFLSDVVRPIEDPSPSAVKAIDPVLVCQLPMIEKIVADETWLEGERRGCWVSPKDPVVRENVCRVILRIGQQLREAALLRAARQLAVSASLDAIVVDDFGSRRAA